MNITHEHPGYQERLRELGSARYNGCYFYAREIEQNIIPRVQTDREWNTVGRDLEGMHDGMIVFLHDNSTPWNYKWLKNYKDLILVCSSKYTADSVCYSGRIVFLPMSVDTEYVRQFRAPKTRETCFVGNEWVLKYSRSTIPDEVDRFSSMPREDLLREVAKYKEAYAIDRCAIEAKVLGCKLRHLDTSYSVDDVGAVLDNRAAARILQASLDHIDKGADMVDYRAIKQGDVYVIQQQDGDKWITLGEFDDMAEANRMLRDLQREF